MRVCFSPLPAPAGAGPLRASGQPGLLYLFDRMNIAAGGADQVADRGYIQGHDLAALPAHCVRRHG